LAKVEIMAVSALRSESLRNVMMGISPSTDEALLVPIGGMSHTVRWKSKKRKRKSSDSSSLPLASNEAT